MIRTAGARPPKGTPARFSSTTLVWAGLAIVALAGTIQLLLAWQDGLSGGRDFVQDYAAVLKIGQWRDSYEPYNDVTEAVFGGPPHRGTLYSFHAPYTDTGFFGLYTDSIGAGLQDGQPGASGQRRAAGPGRLEFRRERQMR